MGAKIQADEISSIIKERIDNFELNVDTVMNNSRPTLCIVGTDDYMYLRLQAAVEAATAGEWPIEICTTSQQMKEVLSEQLYIDEMVFAEKENHPYGWYRKFEKKRF